MDGPAQGRARLARIGVRSSERPARRGGLRRMITVVICTRDRAAKLARCLDHLAATCGDPGLAWQLVVVDNASLDETRAVIQRFVDRLPLEYAHEPRPGLANARNRGVALARHPLVAFTDDDCLVGDAWLRGIVDEFADHPNVSVLGGSVVLDDADDYPVSIRVHATPEAITSARQIMSIMSGSNMMFRREVFERVGLFDAAFGKGRRVGAAEDLDMLYRVLKQPLAMRYAPHLVVRHAHGRRTPDALRSLVREYVRGRGAFYCKFIRDRQIAQMAYWEVRGLFGDWLRVPHGMEAPRLLGHLATGALYCMLEATAHNVARLARRENA